MEFSLLPSGRRYVLPDWKTNRFLKSFIPSAIRLLNALWFHLLPRTFHWSVFLNLSIYSFYLISIY